MGHLKQSCCDPIDLRKFGADCLGMWLAGYVAPVSGTILFCRRVMEPIRSTFLSKGVFGTVKRGTEVMHDYRWSPASKSFLLVDELAIIDHFATESTRPVIFDRADDVQSLLKVVILNLLPRREMSEGSDEISIAI